MRHPPLQEEFNLDGFDSDDGADQEVPEDTKEDSDYEQITSALLVPPPNAEIAELRKVSLCRYHSPFIFRIYLCSEWTQVLALCQKTLTAAHAKLVNTTKELKTLKAALPPKKCREVLSKSDSLNESIGQVAKMFALLYCLWVIDSLFPIEKNPCVDLFSVDCWASSVAKRNAVVTEIFTIAPKTLHKEIATYQFFGSVVHGPRYLRHCLYINNVELLTVLYHPESREI